MDSVFETLKATRGYFRLSLWLSALAIIILLSGVEVNTIDIAKTLNTLQTITSEEYEVYLNREVIGEIFDSLGSDVSVNIVALFANKEVKIHRGQYPLPKWQLDLHYKTPPYPSPNPTLSQILNWVNSREQPAYFKPLDHAVYVEGIKKLAYRPDPTNRIYTEDTTYARSIDLRPEPDFAQSQQYQFRLFLETGNTLDSGKWWTFFDNLSKTEIIRGQLLTKKIAEQIPGPLYVLYGSMPSSKQLTPIGKGEEFSVYSWTKKNFTAFIEQNGKLIVPALASDWRNVKDLTVGETFKFYETNRKKKLSGLQTFQIFNFSIRASIIITLLPATYFLINLFIFLHVFSLSRIIEGYTYRIHYPWIGLYSDWVSKGTIALLIGILPVVIWFVLYSRIEVLSQGPLYMYLSLAFLSFTVVLTFAIAYYLRSIQQVNERKEVEPHSPS